MTNPPAAAPIRLLVVDDHVLFRRGLVALLGQDGRFAVCAEAGDTGEALRAAAHHAPDVVLLDNHLPGVRGVDAIGALKEVAPQAQIVLLTVSEEEDDLVAALQGGAEGYLLKTVQSETLCESIVKVVAGDTVVSPELTRKLVAAFRSRAGTPASAPRPAEPPDTLSAREREILSLIAKGASNKVIARSLDIAETTVKIHVQHILRKLGLQSRVQAAVYAAARAAS